MIKAILGLPLGASPKAFSKRGNLIVESLLNKIWQLESKASSTRGNLMVEGDMKDLTENTSFLPKGKG